MSFAISEAVLPLTMRFGSAYYVIEASGRWLVMAIGLFVRPRPVIS